MKVLYDCQIYNSQRWGGISRYFVELAKSMPEGIDVEFAVRFTHNVHLPEILPVGDFPAVPFKKDIVKALNMRRSKSAIAAGDFDVFHPTYYKPYFLDKLRKPYVVTVHDMIHERFAREFAASDATARNKRRLVENAAAVIAISESTKRDLVDIYGIDPGRVDVVYHGRGVSAAEAAPVEGLPERYLLYVGGRMRYKNFGPFAEAFAAVASRYPDLHLVCSGKPFTAAELQSFDKLGIAGRVHSRFVGDGQMRALYAGAECFVFPSLYEGFGFPVLEAFEAGCPTLLSSSSSLPEVGGDCALYFDPGSVDDMAGAICRILDDAPLRNSLLEKAPLQLQKFSWERCAAQTADIYRRVAENNRE